MSCEARQHSDQMICHKCGLSWDTNDPDPPECNDGVRVEVGSKPQGTKPKRGGFLRRNKQPRGYTDGRG